MIEIVWKSVVLGAALSLTCCRTKETARVGPLPEGSVASSWVEAATAPIDGGDVDADDATLSASPGVMDETFRRTLAADLVAEIRRSDWASLLPSTGILEIAGACISLEDGRPIPARASRICSTPELATNAVVNDLPQLADELQHRSGRPEEGWFCKATICTFVGGENGFNGELRFTRDGAFVRLSEIDTHCGGAFSNDDLRRLNGKNVKLSAPACRKH